jgi:ArsR family transcriptional regulator, arsenate/arsenite/antimonite-responsive transcriptional repressor
MSMKRKLIGDKDVIEIAKALADPNRLTIYRQIASHDEMYCQEMVTTNGISHSTLSHHLKILSEVGLVKSRKAGLNKYYRAVPVKFAAFVSYMQDIAEATQQKHS